MKKVKALILVHHPQEVLQTEGIGATTKSLREMGYQCETRLLKAEMCGAASWATYFVTIATLSSASNPLQLHRLPSDLHLPISPRDCGNVIVKHFVKGVTEERFFVGYSRDIVKEENPSFPNFIGTHKGRPVYSCDGPLPSDPRLLIVIPDRPAGRKDLRAPQRVEWGKIKFGKEQDNLSLLDTIPSIESNVISVLGYHRPPKYVPKVLQIGLSWPRDKTWAVDLYFKLIAATIFPYQVPL